MERKTRRKKETIGPSSEVLSQSELKKAICEERVWLDENNAVSAVTGGHVEDLQGVPLPVDLHQGTPPTQPHPDAREGAQRRPADDAA